MVFLIVKIAGSKTWTSAVFGYKYALIVIILYIYSKVPLDDHYTKLLSQYPFISYLTYGGNDYIGIVQNFDEVITTLYDFGAIKEDQFKKLFLELGEVWWWESNRLIPINVFLKQDWMIFKGCLRTMNSKDVEIKIGPYVSLKEMASKRSKRKSITLIRKIN